MSLKNQKSDSTPQEKIAEEYIIIKSLGKGISGEVKLGQHIKTKKIQALKILNLKNPKKDYILETFKNEKKVMENLSHKNIIKFIDLKDGTLKLKNGDSFPICYEILELASKGEIFDVLLNMGNFNENLTRFFSYELFLALEYLHGNNIAHRDLKLQNLLIDDSLNLKVADFGFATVIKKISKFENGILFHSDEKNRTRLGTLGYMAPEMFLNKAYDAKKADIFSFGIIIFIFYFGYPPFETANSKDFRFVHFVRNPNQFWKYHFKESKITYSETLVFLLSKMLAFNPEERFDITEVGNSEWMRKEINFIKAKRYLKKYFEVFENFKKIRDRVMEKENLEIGEDGVEKNLNDVKVKRKKRIQKKY